MWLNYNDSRSSDRSFFTHFAQGTLNLGDASNSIEQTFARPLRVGSTGLINEGKLSVTSLANFGNIEIESLNIHNGMKRILDALPDQTQPDQGSPNRSINAKGSLKNIGGRIEISRISNMKIMLMLRKDIHSLILVFSAQNSTWIFES